MTLMAMVDYGLIVLFFLGVAGLMLAVIRVQLPAETPAREVESAKQTRAREPYVLLGALIALLAVLTFFARHSEPDSSSD